MASVLRGHASKQVLARGHEKLSTFGLLPHASVAEVRGYIEQLTALGLLRQTGDVYPVLALTPAGRLIVFEASDKGFKQLGDYKVAEGGTYAYPVVAGNRVFIKDRNSLTLYTIE